MLIGETVLVDGELHFRPDGFRYLVPIDQHASDGAMKLVPGARIRVTGQIGHSTGSLTVSRHPFDHTIAKLRGRAA